MGKNVRRQGTGASAFRGLSFSELAQISYHHRFSFSRFGVFNLLSVALLIHLLKNFS
jgi:hypothetical protein